jgi:phosphohistidine phosphatase SixA
MTVCVKTPASFAAGLHPAAYTAAGVPMETMERRESRAAPGKTSIRWLWRDGNGFKRFSKRGGATVAGIFAIFLSLAPGPSAADDTALWAVLRSDGHVALLRHAIAPGTGDPPTFVVGDCSTQRNLSDEGRDQADRIGASFRTNGIATARVFSSQWCRCRETAEHLGLGPVAELPILNSFFQRPEGGDAQTRALRQWLAAKALDGPLVLVTHQVNITALTGVYPVSGELVIIRRTGDGEIVVVGSLETE